MLQTHVPPACFAAPFSLSALPSLLSLYITSTNLQVSFPHKYGSYLCFPPPFLPAVCWRNLRLQFTSFFNGFLTLQPLVYVQPAEHNFRRIFRCFSLIFAENLWRLTLSYAILPFNIIINRNEAIPCNPVPNSYSRPHWPLSCCFPPANPRLSRRDPSHRRPPASLPQHRL